MSVPWGTQYAKLKTNLRLAANRLKLLQKKKTEQAVKARTEIADFLLNDKEDRARIRIESVIREDFVVEAYELLEMFCELLLARFGIIQQMKELDDGIAEAVASLLWVAPRISHEISEFKIISSQLEHKYGKQYAETARMNQLPEPSRVSPKLIQKLSVSAPSKLLVEKYLIEIAKCAGVDFVPDPKVMRDDDNEITLAERNLINFMNEDQIGWNVPANKIESPPVPLSHPPTNNQGGIPPYGNYPPTQPAPGFSAQYPTPNVHPYPGHPQHLGHPQHPGHGGIGSDANEGGTQFGRFNDPSRPTHLDDRQVPPPPPQLNSHNPIVSNPKNKVLPPFNVPPPSNVPPPLPPSNVLPKQDPEHIYETPFGDDKDFEDYEFPEPPTEFDNDYKNNGGGGNTEKKKDEINFEDLAERFKKLTKK